MRAEVSERILLKGNEAFGEASVRAGCRYFFGYPITPQSELPHYLSRRLPEVGGVYLQSESEVAAINMVFGASGAGGRVMTSSSGPGISLMSEGLSYLAGAELPCVVVNVMRGGPGLGNTLPAQADYNQATKGGGHGDYHLLVLAPYSVQEIIDLTYEAFFLAELYRNPVMVLADGVLGQMLEPVRLPEAVDPPPPTSRPWATTGRVGGPKRVVSSLRLPPHELDEHNCHLQEKYRRMAEAELRYDSYQLEDAELVLVAFGIASRIGRAAVDLARQRGVRAGLFRPVSLWPFPYQVLAELSCRSRVRGFLSLELNMGQMVEDVRAAVQGRVPVNFYGRTGGIFPTPREVLDQIEKLEVEARVPDLFSAAVVN